MLVGLSGPWATRRALTRPGRFHLPTRATTHKQQLAKVPSLSPTPRLLPHQTAAGFRITLPHHTHPTGPVASWCMKDRRLQRSVRIATPTLIIESPSSPNQHRTQSHLASTKTPQTRYGTLPAMAHFVPPVPDGSQPADFAHHRSPVPPLRRAVE